MHILCAHEKLSFHVASSAPTQSTSTGVFTPSAAESVTLPLKSGGCSAASMSESHSSTSRVTVLAPSLAEGAGASAGGAASAAPSSPSAPSAPSSAAGGASAGTSASPPSAGSRCASGSGGSSKLGAASDSGDVSHWFDRICLSLSRRPSGASVCVMRSWMSSPPALAMALADSSLNLSSGSGSGLGGSTTSPSSRSLG